MDKLIVPIFCTVLFFGIIGCKMKKLFFGAVFFLFTCSLFAQTDMGRYREIQMSDDLRIYIIKSQRCADIDSAWDFWSNNAFLWNSKWIINNQQDSKDYPDAYWKQADDNMFKHIWSNHQHFDDGVAYVFRTVMNVDNEFRLIGQRLIYFSPDGNTVWYYYSLDSLWEHY
jgi:hypothetical protein